MNVTLVTNQVPGVSKLRYQDLTPLDYLDSTSSRLPERTRRSPPPVVAK